MPYSEQTRRAFQRFARVHGALLVRTKGRPRSLGWGQTALVLETVGRRSGQIRRTPLLYMAEGDGFVVLASNYGQERPPAWYHNLMTRPDAHVLWSGKRVAVHARESDGDERDELVERARTCNAQWRSYLATVDREIPVLVLERTT